MARPHERYGNGQQQQGAFAHLPDEAYYDRGGTIDVQNGRFSPENQPSNDEIVERAVRGKRPGTHGQGQQI